jgi:hypothetical protein
MNRSFSLQAGACALCICAAFTLQSHAQPAQTGTFANVRERIPMDAGWHFALGNAADQHKDFDFATIPFFFAKAGYGDGPASPKFDDRTWRVVNLPHDWAVELPFDRRGDGNHGSKAIGRNFPENSVGWYRKSFTIPAEDLGRRIGIDFDGVYRDSQVWVNGFYLGTEPSGYSKLPLRHDRLPQLRRRECDRGARECHPRRGLVLRGRRNLPSCVAHQDQPAARGARRYICYSRSGRSSRRASRGAGHSAGHGAERRRLQRPLQDRRGDRGRCRKVCGQSISVRRRRSAASSSDYSATIPVHDAHLWSLEDPISTS